MNRLPTLPIPLWPMRHLGHIVLVRVQIVHKRNSRAHDVLGVLADGVRDRAEDVEKDVGDVEGAEERDRREAGVAQEGAEESRT